MKRKIICFSFALLMLLSILPFSVFATEASLNDVKNLSVTEIDEDFKYTFAGSLDVKDYPASSKDTSIYLVSIMEGKSSSGSVELYLYMYNPSRKEIVKDTGLDKVTLAVYSSESDESKDEYVKYDISLLKTYGGVKESGSATDALLLKYKLVLGSEYKTDITRYYRVSELEVLAPGASTAVAYRAGKEFKFFNDKAGYVNFTEKDLTTLEMEAFHTFYRVNTDGVDRYTDIQSVYFAVPNKLLEQYGGLYSMDCSWAKASTNLGIVLSDRMVADEIQKSLIDGNSACKYGIFYDRYWPGGDGGWVYDNYSFAINTGVLDDYIKRQVHEDVDDFYVYKWSDSTLFADVIGYGADCYVYPLKMVFYSDKAGTFEERAMAGEEIVEYINKYGWESEITDSFLEDLYDGKISPDAFNELVSGPIFYPGVNRIHTFTVERPNKSLQVYEPCNGWQKFWNGGMYDKDTGEEIEFSYFEKIDLADLDKLSIDAFADKYKVDRYDVSCGNGECGACISCNTKSEKYNDCTWFLLRYDTTNYQSYESLIVNAETGVKACDSYTFYADVIKGFDTISLTLADSAEQGAVKTVFPLIKSPTNFASDSWSPSEKPDSWIGDLRDGADDWLGIFELIFKILLGLFLLLIIFKICDIIKPVFVGAFKIVKSPFKKKNQSNERKDKK